MKNNGRRQALLVVELKYGRVVTPRGFRSLLARQRPAIQACLKTVERDVKFLRDSYGAPIEYDRRKGGYRFAEGQGNWSLPNLFLEKDALFAFMFSHRLSDPFLPPPLQQTVQEVQGIEVAAADSTPASAQLLSSVIIATGAGVPVPDAVYRSVIQAWRETRTLRISYMNRSGGTSTDREIDVHALFLAQGVWYARAHCHLRKEARSFALHRMQSAALTERTFARSQEIVRQIASGYVFDYRPLCEARVWCSRENARFFRERTWFPGQRVEEQPDKSQVLVFPSVPLPVITQWVMACMGDVTVLEPASLRDRIREITARMAQDHADSTPPCNRQPA